MLIHLMLFIEITPDRHKIFMAAKWSPYGSHIATMNFFLPFGRHMEAIWLPWKFCADRDSFLHPTCNFVSNRYPMKNQFNQSKLTALAVLVLQVRHPKCFHRVLHEVYHRVIAGDPNRPAMHKKYTTIKKIDNVIFETKLYIIL